MTSGPEIPIRIVRKHHPLVRLTHWVNVPLLLGLTVSGLSIYWAAPVFLHRPDPVTHSMDYLRDAGMAIARVLPDPTGEPRFWIYEHFSLGPRQLAIAMIRYYSGMLPAAIARRPWPHPPVRSKYNALQRGAYFAMSVFGLFVILSGWAMHKPVQLGWLERLFVNYDGARIVHFVCMLALASFLIPHVILVIADGWDTFRSMVVGWSVRVKEDSHGGA